MDRVIHAVHAVQQVITKEDGPYPLSDNILVYMTYVHPFAQMCSCGLVPAASGTVPFSRRSAYDVPEE